MRISTNLMQQLGVQAILDRQADVSRTQLQISTGRQILNPSDDPSGSARILSLNSFIATIEQYQDNAGQAESRLRLEEITLAAMADVLQRVRELAVQGANDSLAADSRAGIAAEVDQRLEELLQLGNTQDANGEYLFGGYQVDTPPFEQVGVGVFRYNGDQGQRMLDIGSSRSVADRDSGFEVAMNVRTTTGAAQDIFSTVFGFLQNMSNNTPATSDIDDLDLALDNLLRIRADVGGRLNAIESQTVINGGFILDTQVALSEIQDLDYAEAVARFESQLVAFQAAEQAFIKVQGLSLFNFL